MTHVVLHLLHPFEQIASLICDEYLLVGGTISEELLTVKLGLDSVLTDIKSFLLSLDHPLVDISHLLDYIDVLSLNLCYVLFEHVYGFIFNDHGEIMVIIRVR